MACQTRVLIEDQHKEFFEKQKISSQRKILICNNKPRYLAIILKTGKSIIKSMQDNLDMVYSEKLWYSPRLNMIPKSLNPKKFRTQPSAVNVMFYSFSGRIRVYHFGTINHFVAINSYNELKNINSREQWMISIPLNHLQKRWEFRFYEELGYMILACPGYQKK